MSAHVQEQLSAFMDGVLSAADESVVREHLRVCPSCARLLDELAAVDEAVRALPVDAPAGYFDTFAGRVRGRLEAARPAARTATVPRWAWALAAGLLLAVVTPLTLRQTPGSGSVPDEPVGPRSAARQDAAPPPAPRAAPLAGTAPSLAPPEPNPAPAGQEGRLAAAGPRKGVAAGPPAQSAAAPPPKPTARQEELSKRPAPADTFEADAPKAQTGPPVFLEDEQKDKREARSPKAPEAPAALEAGAGKKDTQLAAAGQARDQARGGAAGEAAPFAQEPRAAAAPGERAKLRRGIDKPRTSEPVAAAPLGLEAEAALLRQRAVTDLAAARELREAWRRFGLRNSESAYADEARVGAIEAGAEAVRLGGDPADRELLEQDAASYLERDESRQKARVQRILRRLDP